MHCPEWFESQAKAIYGDRYLYTRVNFVRTKDKVRIICREHGDFLWTIAKHLKGYGCPKCQHRIFLNGGFDTNKKATFYIYTFGDYVGFGITNNFKVRNTQHRISFEKANVVAELFARYDITGEVALITESYAKKKLNIVDAGIVGFKTEAIHKDDLQELLAVVNKHVKE